MPVRLKEAHQPILRESGRSGIGETEQTIIGAAQFSQDTPPTLAPMQVRQDSAGADQPIGRHDSMPENGADSGADKDDDELDFR